MAGSLGLGYPSSGLLVSGDGLPVGLLASTAIGSQPLNEVKGVERVHEEDEVQPRKILVVDDSKLIHKMFEVLLRQYSLVHCLDGLEALQALNNHADIDLILLDINMPRMSGLEFLNQIKADATFQEIPVVIISTEGKEEDTVRGLEAGAAAYIKKPFGNQELLEVIQRL